MTPELITKIVEAVLTIILALVSAYLIPWIKNKLGDDRYRELVEFCEICVRSAEQLFTEEQAQEKKTYVVEMIVPYVRKLGLNLGEEEINAIIESCVNFVKYGMEYTK